MKKHIGVLGPNTTTNEQYLLGVEVGRCVAEAGAILFCGGLGGMMRAAAEGAKSAAVNVLAFVQMASDKQRAVKGRRRLPEALLLAPVLFSGILGVVAGMLAFHHKIAKTSFHTHTKLVIAFVIFLVAAYQLLNR